MLLKDMTPGRDRTQPAPRAPDREIVERMISGDESAFRELLARYRSTVYATVYAALQDPEKAETIVADTFDEARRTAIASRGGSPTSRACGSTARRVKSRPSSSPESPGASKVCDVAAERVVSPTASHQTQAGGRS